MGAKLLIVDNEPPQLAKFLRAAKEAGFQDEEIVSTDGAGEAAAKLMTETFDVALVDLVLASTDPTSEDVDDALELIRQIRRYQPECRVIALTRSNNNEAGIRAMTAGASDFVCTRWEYINGEELLVQRLRLWRGVVADRDMAMATA